MSVNEREAFELRLIEEDDFSDLIETVEFDLVEDFAAGVLPLAEHEQIALWIKASPERSARVLLAQTLHQSSSKRRRSATLWIWWTAALSACVILTISLLLLRRPQPAPSTLASSQVATHAPFTPRQDTILLIAERLRGGNIGSATSYPLHADSSVRLQIMVPPSDGRTPYSATLQGNEPGGASLLHISGITPRGDASAPYLELTLPPRSLPSGKYMLELRSRTDNYQLSFRVKIE